MLDIPQTASAPIVSDIQASVIVDAQASLSNTIAQSIATVKKHQSGWLRPAVSEGFN
jgi:hypothetical protein